MQLRRTGVECLVSDFALFAAIQRVGAVRAELGHVEVVNARADFLIRGEGDAELAVRGVGGEDVSSAVIISAMPALSSAPSRVVPSVVMSVMPTSFFRPGNAAGLSVSPLPARSTSPPS